MSKFYNVIRRIKDGTFIDSIRNQPSKYKRKKWEAILNSSVKSVLFNYKNIFIINLPVESELSQYIYQNNFERDEIKFVKKYLNNGDYFIDIGTNIGFFSLLASKRIGKEGKVFSFEPTTNTFNRFLENIEINNASNIVPIKNALSDKEGFFNLNTSQDGFDAWNSFAKPVCGDFYLTESVQTITLTAFFDENKIFEKVKLIKIDVEGWEKFVLLGGENYLRKINAPNLLIEFVDDHTRNAGYSCMDLYKYLNELGYNIYHYSNGELKPQPILGWFKGFNFIATKDIINLKKRIR